MNRGMKQILRSCKVCNVNLQITHQAAFQSFCHFYQLNFCVIWRMCSSTALHLLYSGSCCSRSTRSQMSALETWVLMKTSERCDQALLRLSPGWGDRDTMVTKKIDISSAELHLSWQMVDLMMRNNVFSVCRCFCVQEYLKLYFCLLLSHRFCLIMIIRLKWMLNAAVSLKYHWDRKTHCVAHPHCETRTLTESLWKRIFLQYSI